MTRRITYWLLPLLMLCSCAEPVIYSPPVIQPQEVIDMAEIQERGKLVVLTENTSISYYLYKGHPMGYDFELLHAFAKDQGLELEIKVIEDVNDMFELLNEGEGDIIACNLTVTADRKNIVQFTEPLTTTKQVLVQRKPDGWRKMRKRALKDSLVQDIQELAGLSVHVHEYSSFYSRLLSVQDEIGESIDIQLASGDVDSEGLIRQVVDGEIDFTVTDENMALLNQTYYPDLDVSTAISLNQSIAWAVRHTSDSLHATLNEWLLDRGNDLKLSYTHRKYFESPKDQRDRVQSEYSSISGKKISKYDDVIKDVAVSIGWDWRLLAALIYQESRFNPDAKSWAGAFGLMQMMPQTAARFGIDSTDVAAANVVAGGRYLAYLEKVWEDDILDSLERKKFILASYNAGPGHVFDAMALAREFDMNPQDWNQVKECLVKKSEAQYYTMEVVKHGYCRGRQPVAYVNNVMNSYGHYVSLN
jgi:membrane-bound lytic murein transglycosylase F